MYKTLVYTLLMATFKDLHIETAKITKGDIIQQHIDTLSV